MDRFVEICEKYIEDAPANLRGNIENGYITLLRILKEKINRE